MASTRGRPGRRWRMGRLFDGATQEYSASRVAAVVDTYDFSEVGTIDDVAAAEAACLPGS